jgi:hypothetical protein
MPDEDSKQLQEELKQPAAEEIGYGKISDNLMLQGFGQWYILRSIRCIGSISYILGPGDYLSLFLHQLDLIDKDIL